MAHKGVPVFGRIKAMPEPVAPVERGGRFEAGVKLTHLLVTGHTVTIALIVERFEVSAKTARDWFDELAELLPVEVTVERTGRRGPPPRVMRWAGAGPAENRGSAP